MVIPLGTLACIGLLLAYAPIERVAWKTYITPTTIFISSYAIVSAFIWMTSGVLDYYPLSWKTYGLIALYSTISLAASLIMSLISASLPKRTALEPNHAEAPSNPFPLLAISAVFMALAFRLARANGGLWSSQSKDVLSRGLISHIHVVLAFMIVFYFTANASGKKNWLAVLFALAALSLRPVKGWILIPSFAAILILLDGRKKNIIRYLFITLAAAALIVTALFLIIYGSRSKDSAISSSIVTQILRHLAFYLTSGFFGLNAIANGLTLGASPLVLVAPAVNLLSTVTGDPLMSPISSAMVQTIESYGGRSNVYSLIGSLTGYAGALPAALFFLFIMTGIYSMRIAADFCGSNLLRTGYWYWMSIILFSSFDYYFWLLTPLEVLFYSGSLFLASIILSYSRTLRR